MMPRTRREMAFDTVDAYAPNFKRSIFFATGALLLHPFFERTFGLIGGDIFHGALLFISCSVRDRCS